MKTFLTILLCVLCISTNVNAEEKAPRVKKQTTARKQTSPDPASIAREYLEKNCVVALRGYTTDLMTEQKMFDGEATGTLMSGSGGTYVLTNTHVIQNTTDIWAVFFHDIVPQKMQIVGSSNATDIATLVFSDKNFHPPCALELGDSSTLSAGDEVFSIGSLSFIQYALTRGHVIKTGLMLAEDRDNLVGLRGVRLDPIFSDLPLNPGSSGSPLFNTKGKVVGINHGATNTSTPIAISISSNLIKKVLPKILKGGEVKHGLVNIILKNSTELTPLDKGSGTTPKFRNGPIVTSIPLLSTAGNAGLKVNDMIISVGKTPTPTVKDFYTTMVFDLEPNTVAIFTILREEEKDGKTEQVYKTIDVSVEEFFTNFR